MKEKDPKNIHGNTRRELLGGIGMLAAGSLVPQQASAASQTDPAKPAWDKPFSGTPPKTPPAGYNILLITTDQERHFDPYPFPVPGRERLLKTGISFCRHENNSNVCTSSRSVLYTGLHMPQTRMFDNIGLPWMSYPMDPKLGTIGHMMGKLGYYTAYKGKWHLTPDFEKPIPNVPVEKVDIGDIPRPHLYHIMEEYGFADYHGIGDIIGHSKGGYFYDSIISGQTVNWLRSKGRPLNDDKKPWFLAINLVNPHDVMFIDTDNPNEDVQWHKPLDQNDNSLAPTQPPENSLYRASWTNAPLPENRHQSLTEPGRPAAHLEYQKARAVMVGQFPDEDRRWRKLQDYYFNCIRDCDMHLERILDELDDLGLTDNTIIVFTSDHGELGGAHQMHGKGSSIYQEQIHVPLIIRHPAYPGGQRCQALTCHLDIVPTLVGLTGASENEKAKVLGERKGKDLTRILANASEAGLHAVRDAALYCYGMLLYTDATYLAKVRELQSRTDLSPEMRKIAIRKLHPDFRHRSAIRMINDGNFKFARYFSLKEHNTPETWEALTALNDLEFYDLKSDPQENINLAANREKYKAEIMVMNTKLNDIIKAELGVDDGSFMPNLDNIPWDLTVEQFNEIAND